MGNADGIGTAATFSFPAYVAIDPSSSYALVVRAWGELGGVGARGGGLEEDA